jgi:16S rRNA (guanine966-N2)-methyltransferase
MADRVRGGLFNTLGDIAGLTVLDAYAGSGALCFEAVSRGASHATAIDIDKEAHRTIVRNIQDLDLDAKVQVYRKQISSWVSGHPNLFFDLIFCDPPYHDLRRDVLLKIAKRLDHEGTFVLSWPGREKPPVFAGLSLVRQKSYGDAQLIFYKRQAVA